MWAMLWGWSKKLPKLLPYAIAIGLLLAAHWWFGNRGFRSGMRVSGGFDPEQIRLLYSGIVALIGLLLAKAPYGDVLKALWERMNGGGQALTPDEQRDQYARIKRLAPDPPVPTPPPVLPPT